MTTEERRAYDKRWYQNNRSRRQEINKRYKRRLRTWIRELKAARGCDRCPENDPVCLDWHHRDPDSKVMAVGDMASYMKSKVDILAEIEKCDLYCANCHRKLHRADDCVNDGDLSLRTKRIAGASGSASAL